MSLLTLILKLRKKEIKFYKDKDKQLKGNASRWSFYFMLVFIKSHSLHLLIHYRKLSLFAFSIHFSNHFFHLILIQ